MLPSQKFPYPDSNGQTSRVIQSSLPHHRELSEMTATRPPIHGGPAEMGDARCRLPFHGERPQMTQPPFQGERPQMTRPPFHGERPQMTLPPFHGERLQMTRPPFHGERPQMTRPPFHGERPQMTRPPFHGERPQMTLPAFHGERPQMTRPPFHGERPQMTRPLFHGERPQMARPPFHGERPPVALPHFPFHGRPPHAYHQGDIPRISHPHPRVPGQMPQMTCSVPEAQEQVLPRNFVQPTIQGHGPQASESCSRIRGATPRMTDSGSKVFEQVPQRLGPHTSFHGESSQVTVSRFSFREQTSGMMQRQSSPAKAYSQTYPPPFLPPAPEMIRGRPPRPMLEPPPRPSSGFLQNQDLLVMTSQPASSIHAPNQVRVRSSASEPIKDFLPQSTMPSSDNPRLRMRPPASFQHESFPELIPPPLQTEENMRVGVLNLSSASNVDYQCDTSIPPRHLRGSCHVPIQPERHSSGKPDSTRVSASDFGVHRPPHEELDPIQKFLFKVQERKLDQDWVNKWISSLSVRKSDKSKPTRTPILIPNVRRDLKQCIYLVTVLEKKRREMAKVEDREEWQWEVDNVKVVMNSLDSMMSKIRNEEVKKRIKMKLQKVKKKKKQRLRKKKRVQLEKKKRTEKLRKRNEEIDIRLKQQEKRVQEEAQRNEDNKAMNGAISVVQRQQQDVKRSLQTLTAVCRLREARMKKRSAQLGLDDTDSTFQTKSAKLKELLEHQLETYSAEEERFKEKLKRAGDEDNKKFNALLKQLKVCFFGESLEPSHPLFKVYSEFTRAESDVDHLVAIRSEWDSYLVDADHPMGSSIPTDWVFPSFK